MRPLRSWFTRIVRGPSMLPARWWEFRDVGAAIQAACMVNVLADFKRQPVLEDQFITAYVQRAFTYLPKSP